MPSTTATARTWRNVVLIASLAALSAPAAAGEAIDLFRDVAPLGDGAVRIGTWNVRHVDVSSPEAEFLIPGTTREDKVQTLVSTFAKGIEDLGLDVAAIVEHQPRRGEPDRLVQIVARLNRGAPGPWRGHASDIDYGLPQLVERGSYSGLQFAVVWNSERVSIDPAQTRVLEQLRQPRDGVGRLGEKTRRVPWLVPLTVGSLELDLVVVHLKSGGRPPQAAEVSALAAWMRARQSRPGARHLVLIGDWNLRPDRADQRERLAELQVPADDGHLMRILTLEENGLGLEGWEGFGKIRGGTPLARVLPFSHFNRANSSLETLLDHVAISRTLGPYYRRTLPVRLRGGRTDVVPGCDIVETVVPEREYELVTDHLPVVLNLSTTPVPRRARPKARLAIVAILPNPEGEDEQAEAVHLRNDTPAPIDLAGWRLVDAAGGVWDLVASDGQVAPGRVVVVRRLGREMALSNKGGDTVAVRDPTGAISDVRSYTGDSAPGQLFEFR